LNSWILLLTTVRKSFYGGFWPDMVRNLIEISISKQPHTNSWEYQPTYLFVSEALWLLACTWEVRMVSCVFWAKQGLARILLWSAIKEWLANYISPSYLKKVCILFRTPFSTSQVKRKIKWRIREHRGTLIWHCDTVLILVWVILKGIHFGGEHFFTAISVHLPSTSCSLNSEVDIYLAELKLWTYTIKSLQMYL
jgi:hypothetical protein